MRIKNVVFVKSKLATCIQLYSVPRIKTDAMEFCFWPVSIHCSITVNALWSLWGLTRCYLFFWCSFFSILFFVTAWWRERKCNSNREVCEDCYTNSTICSCRSSVCYCLALGIKSFVFEWIHTYSYQLTAKSQPILHCCVFECVCLRVFESAFVS